MVLVELAGDVVRPGVTSTNLIDGQVGQSLVMMNSFVVFGGGVVAGDLGSVLVEVGPEIVIGGQVGHGL